FLHREPLPAFEEFGPVRREPLRSVRRRTARHMVTASLVIPHVAHMDEADITELESVRRAQKERLGDRPGGRLTLLAFVMKALVAGLKAHPRFNASIDPDREEIVYKDHYHLGFAADTPRGLLVPVIRDADRRSILDLSAAVEHLAGRARDGTIGADEMRGGTFTVTNIGAMGGTGLIPLINHPEVAILGMGRAQQKPVVRDGAVVVRTMLPLVLAFDHRIADGGDAVRFVNDLVRRLQDPNALLVEA
ncbi:MAG TPA: 2-oxo acid dehydrogenase subunit E2, partial [Myxococcota bacterium]|nr:2-oxo acid dehydrogenase subunit E2 [Myxococcota bacterium]